jgi:hypothetical protein
MIDMNVGPFHSDIRLHKAIVIGAENGDVVGWWMDVPIMVRCNVKDDRLHCVPLDKIPDSNMLDRQRAGAIRLNAHNGSLDSLRD